MIYGDNPQKINEREDKLGLKSYSYAPQISAIMQAGNLYVYCGNNPVLYADITGNAFIHIIFSAIGTLVGWPFGDYVASSLNLTGWKYWAVRSAVAVGGAALGWFSGTALSRIVAIYLKGNVELLFRLTSKLGQKTVFKALEFFGIYPFSIVSGSGKFIAMINKLFNSPAIKIGYNWAVSLIDKATELGYKIQLHSGHPGTPWEGVMHINIGKYHIAITPEIWEAIKAYLEANHAN